MTERWYYSCIKKQEYSCSINQYRFCSSCLVSPLKKPPCKQDMITGLFQLTKPRTVQMTESPTCRRESSLGKYINQTELRRKLNIIWRENKRKFYLLKTFDRFSKTNSNLLLLVTPGDRN